MSTLLQAAQEELVRLRTSRSRLILLLAPFLATAFCLWVYSARVARDLPVAVVDLDRTTLSRTLVRDLSSAPQMKVHLLQSEDEVQKEFREGSIRAAAVIPAGLDREVKQGRTARVVFWRDASNPLAANQLYSAMSTVVSTEGARLVVPRLMAVGLPYSQAKEMALPLRSDPRGLENPGFDYLANFAPGLLPMFLQMGLMLAAGTMLPGGWKGVSHPIRKLLGRSLPWLLVQGGAAVIFYLILLPGMGAPHAPILPTLALLGLLIAVALGFGALVGCLASDPLKATSNLLVFNTPAFPLSGYTFPEWAMPAMLARLTRPLPFSLFVDGYRSFAGWACDRAWIGLWGLVAWSLGSWLLLALASRRASRAQSVPSEPVPVSGTVSTLRAELHLLASNANLKSLFFLAPVVYLALYGGMYALKEERNVPLGLVHGNASALSRELARGLEAHPSIAVIPYASSAQANAALRKGKVRAVLELPENLEVRLRRREATGVPLLFVADRFLPANDLQRGVAEVLLARGTQERLLTMQVRGLSPALAKERATALALDDRPLANPRETYGDFMLPPLGLLVLHQLCFIAAAFATASSGTASLKRLFARLALFVPWFGLWCLVWIVGALRLFEVPVDPQVLPLLLLCLGGLVSVGLLGMCFGLLLKKPLSVLQLAAFTSYPFFFGSGASWPWEAMPASVQAAMQAVPLAPWLAGAGRTLRMGAQVVDVRPELVHLSLLIGIWSLVLAGLALRRNKDQEKRLSRT